MALKSMNGKIVMLRVNEVGDKYGPNNDNMQVEVVMQLDSHAEGAASGFKLRNDSSQPGRQGMLDLLRDAFNNGWRVHIDHQIPDGKTKGIIVRVWLTKDAQGGLPGMGPSVLSVARPG